LPPWILGQARAFAVTCCQEGATEGHTSIALLLTATAGEAVVNRLLEPLVRPEDWSFIERGSVDEKWELLSTKLRLVPPLERSKVQRKLGLRELKHHAIGRHSVASQAATGGESIKAIQAQLGHRSEQSTHRYAHLGSKAQLRLIEGLKPQSPPHVSGRRVNVVSTETKTGSQPLS